MLIPTILLISSVNREALRDNRDIGGNMGGVNTTNTLFFSLNSLTQALFFTEMVIMWKAGSVLGGLFNFLVPRLSFFHENHVIFTESKSIQRDNDFRKDSLFLLRYFQLLLFWKHSFSLLVGY